MVEIPTLNGLHFITHGFDKSQLKERILYWSALHDVRITQEFINEVYKSVKKDNPTLLYFNKKEEYSLENFYINRFGKKLYSMFFENYTEKLWGRHPKEISADWGKQRVKGLSVFGIILY